MLWTTGGAGDGASTYTRQNMTDCFKVLAACHGLEGVAPAALNTLDGSIPAANTFRVATGYAVVDGKAYYSDANVDVNIPSAVGGGNTRIDRIVLRAGWAAQTVRITRIAGTDAASPTPPAYTKTPSTTYDILLYQVRVNTSGTVTIELDEREWARISTAEIDALGVTEAKLASAAAAKLVTNGNSHDHNGGDGAAIVAGGLADGAVNTTAKLANDIVDDTKVGNRVPQFYRRQGGDASDWIINGTTSYTPTTVRMQSGSVNVAGNLTITFPVAFSNKPIVLMTPVSPYHCRVSVLSATQAILYVFDSAGGAATSIVYWLAIGPE